jgi:hypothetical protein
MVRLPRALAAALLLAALALGIRPVGAAAAGATFGTPTATSTFGQGLSFSQPVDLGVPVDRVELLLTFPGASGPFVVEVQPPGTTGPTTLRYTFDTSGGGLTPNTTVTAQWRVRPAGVHDPLPPGPTVNVTYADTRFTWQTATQGIVRVHWYQGDASFGQQALRIAQDAISTAEKALGVTETRPIDFFMYADRAAFRDAIGTASGEFTVGRAIPETRTFFGLILPGGLSGDTAITIAHELTHIVFDTATRNPYHEPPSWFNEGVAKYLSEGYGSSDRALVSSAAADGSLYPLIGLVPPDLPGQKTFLAYAEADASVDYLVRTFGKDALSGVVAAYAKGSTDEEAFKAGTGKDLTTFQADWFASIGAKVPSAAGPSAAPAGPVPPGWGAGAVGTPGPGATAGGSSSGGSAGSGSSSDTLAPFLGVILVAIVLLGIAFVALRSRRRPPAPVPAAWPGDSGAGQGAWVPGAGAIPPWDAVSDPWPVRPPDADRSQGGAGVTETPDEAAADAGGSGREARDAEISPWARPASSAPAEPPSRLPGDVPAAAPGDATPTPDEASDPPQS